MEILVLSSGSKANCTIIDNGKNALVIDCGISYKSFLRRLESISVSHLDVLSRIRAILISHEHSDHIRGVSVLSRKLGIPVFANQNTLEFIDNVSSKNVFASSDRFELHGYQVYSFPVNHDAVEPVGFQLRFFDAQFTIATDLGKLTNVVKQAIVGSQVILIESNYDNSLLQACEYPWQVKQRISSTQGHLSNDQLSEFLKSLGQTTLHTIVLGHLSKNSNTPELALSKTKKSLTNEDIRIFCASEDEDKLLPVLTC